MAGIAAAAQEYRSADGSGNNQNDPTLGAASTPYATVLGLAAPPRLQQEQISNLRNISNALCDQPRSIPNVRRLSVFHSMWGNFVAQGMYISDTAGSVASEDKFSVPAPSNDPVAQGAVMNMSRSAAKPADSVNRAPLNIVTHFIDGSQIYGFGATQAAAIRDGAFLKLDPATQLLPSLADNPAASNISAMPRSLRADQLFAFADFKANRVVQEHALYVLFTREHNRYVAELKANYTSLSDEQLYQRGRNWVIALMQHYTYYEYLPLLLGKPLPPYTDYDPNVRPDVDTFFAAVAMRYAHSEIPSFMTIVESPGLRRDIDLADTYFNTDIIRQHDLAPLFGGMASSVAEEVDPYYVSEIRNYLFGRNTYMDMMVLDLFRAREYGVSSYVKAARFFNVTVPASLANFSKHPQAAALAQVYQSVDDVDAIVGGLLEDRNVMQTNVGPLFAASISDQFRRLRDGDRFWHERPGVLTDDELARIKGTPFRDVILRNLLSETPEARSTADRILPRNMWQVLADDETDSSGTPLPPGTAFGHAFNGRYQLYWRVEDAVVRFVVSCGYRGWCAFGLGKSMLTATEMYVAHLVPGGQNATVSEYHPPTAYGQPQPPVQATAADGSAVVNVVRSDVRSDGFQVEFTRPLKPGNGRTDITNQQQDLIFAYQPVAEGEGWFTFHGENRGTMSVNFVTGDGSNQSDGHGLTTVQLIHGVCMLVAWGVFSPLGIFVARYQRTHNGWVLTHTGLQASAGIIAVIAAITMICTAQLGNSTHGIIGVAIFSVLCVQLCAGLFNLQRLLGVMGRGVSVGAGDFALRYNRLVHHFTGRAMLLATFINIPVGIQYAYPLRTHSTHPLWVVFFSVVALWVAVYAAFELRRLLKDDWSVISKPGVGVAQVYPDPDQPDDPAALRGRKLNTQVAADRRLCALGASTHCEESLPFYTWADIDKCVNSGALWVIGNGFVYDVRKWIFNHPGGQQVLQSAIGTDISTDYFNNVLYDQRHFEPYTTAPRHMPGDADSHEGSESGSSVSRQTFKGLAPSEINEQMRITANDWKFIIATRHLHFHSRQAIAKLQTLVVGRLEPSQRQKYQQEEYRRYALTAKHRISPDGVLPLVYKVRFCLLYPNETYPEEPLFFLPGQAVQIQLRTKRKIVTRYYTPLNGNMTAFEVIVKCLHKGAMSNVIKSALIGSQQFRIRGPYGVPLVNPEAPIPRFNGCWRNLICIGAGSGITPFLQLASWYFLQTTFSVACARNVPSFSNELPIRDSQQRVFLKYPMQNGWVYCANASTGDEGFLRLNKLVPWVGKSPSMVVVNVGATLDSLIGTETFVTVAQAYPSQLKLLNVVSHAQPPAEQAYDSDVAFGRVDHQYIQALVENYWPAHGDCRIMLCGPDVFMDETRQALLRVGVSSDDIIMLPSRTYLRDNLSNQWRESVNFRHSYQPQRGTLMADLSVSRSATLPRLDAASTSALEYADGLRQRTLLKESLDDQVDSGYPSPVSSPMLSSVVLSSRTSVSSLLPSLPMRTAPNSNVPTWYYLPSSGPE
ncbi:DOMON domain-containing protein frrs1L [Sorochytrium milnesiophthora]